MPAATTADGRALCVATDLAAAEAGAAVLERGGNAFDAAVAAGFVEAVVSPANCGIGGYGATGVGFQAARGHVIALDADAVAPKAAKAGMFPTLPGRDPNDYRLPDDRHKRGPLSVAVPGVLGGLLTLLEHWGHLDRKAVMEAAIRHAREGVVLTPGQAKTWLTMRGVPLPATLPERVGMPDLAETLEAIADEGRNLFYSGRIGRAIAEHVRGLGGLLTPEDMAAYEARVVEPVTVAVRGRTVATVPPPSGGLTSLQIAALMDRLDRDKRLGEPDSARTFEAFLEVLKVAWEERLTTLADPRWMERPPADLLTDEHLDRLLSLVRDGLADPGPGQLVAPDPLRGTVHLAAADAEGNLVAWTQTHGGGFGSGLMVPGTGIVLGHGMCRFEPRPGWPNSVAPGKRPLHNMAPTLVLHDGRAVLAAGASGGRTIVNNVAALLARVLLLDQSPADALAAPRLQCETLEPAVIESKAGEAVLSALRDRGHDIRTVNRDAGKAHLIGRVNDAWVGLAEPRADRAGVAIAGG